MRNFLAPMVASLMAFGTLTLAQAHAQSYTQSCDPVSGRQARIVAGEVWQGDTFAQPLTANWTFKLLPAPYGWDVRLFDKDGIDLTQVTPPFRLAPNAREIYGWHFRNAANTDVNSGDVNAPQHLRLFFFDPALTGTAGFKPSQRQSEPDANAGRGALNILDMKLTDLEPGDKASMSYLKFVGCVNWPDAIEAATVETVPQTQADMLDPIFIDEENELMYGCGLDSEKYELSAWILPRMTGGDFDGDGAGDDVAPIIRKSDGRRGIAICRAGTWMSVLGYGEGTDTPLKTEAGEPENETYLGFSDFLGAAEYWQVRGNGDNALILGRTEKASWKLDGTIRNSYTRWHGLSFDNEITGEHAK